MFFDCSSLESINLSQFYTGNIKTQFFFIDGLSQMFSGCLSLKIENIIFNKKDKKLNNEIFEDLFSINTNIDKNEEK